MKPEQLKQLVGDWSTVTRRSSQQGFGIVEILVAVAVVGTILTAVAAGLAFSLKTSAELKFRGLAVSKAQALMEAVRRERAIGGWDAFAAQATSGTYCFNDDATLLHDNFSWSAAPVGGCATVSWDGNDYVRELTVVVVSPDEIDLTATVYWQGRDKSFELKQVLNKWQ